VKRFEILAFLLTLAGFAASAVVSSRTFERLPHLEDEIAYLWEASVMAQGEISLPSPAHAESFPVPFVIDHQGQRFAKYPPGWPAALSLGVRAGAPWVVNAVFSGFSLWLIFRLGERLVHPWVGVLAQILSLTSPMFLMLGGSLLSHSFSLFLTLAFLTAWLEFTASDGGEVPGWLPVWIAGLALGLLFLTRPLTALGVALPFTVYGLQIVIGKDRRTSQDEVKHVVTVGAIATALALMLPYWQAALTGDPTRNLYTLWWDYDRVGFGPGIGFREGGHSLLLGMGKSLGDLAAGASDLFGWPYISWIFLPFGIWRLSRRKGGLLLLWLIPSLVGVYIFYWVGTHLLGPRYYAEALPSLAIASATGAAMLGGWLADVQIARKWRKRLVVALLPTLILMNLIFFLPTRLGGLVGLYDISRARMDPLEKSELEGGMLIIHPRHWTDYGTLLTLTPPFREGGFQLAVSRGEESDRQVAASFVNRPVFHYYPDEPDRLYPAPR
jgi:hypothetical protein